MFQNNLKLEYLQFVKMQPIIFQIQNRGPSPVEGLYARVSLLAQHNSKRLLNLFSISVSIITLLCIAVLSRYACINWRQIFENEL